MKVNISKSVIKGLPMYTILLRGGAEGGEHALTLLDPKGFVEIAHSVRRASVYYADPKRKISDIPAKKIVSLRNNKRSVHRERRGRACGHQGFRKGQRQQALGRANRRRGLLLQEAYKGLAKAGGVPGAEGSLDAYGHGQEANGVRVCAIPLGSVVLWWRPKA